ncbi:MULTISPECIES: stalk domain-containing protein [Thermoanaerobacterium]|uniref:Copper amine oxidase n=2 Tax=Thermoanaerobacterium TaxID=28895 RepID=W9ECW2_9THEO|nr:MULTISPECIES: stalk domain-containing protein [Thermoanaerobacterium]AFK87391.1 copper amine oxidase-like domain-containing protein [Thermoanaerobacterium saccharolyticum JW/SL-YS485]ETO38855.1 copper amine oxidase [Thermoanaerobacterium aotearoense SCUT27]
MKKLLVFICIVLIGVGIMFSAFAATNDVKVEFTIGKSQYTINGQYYAMDVAPYIKDNRTFLPLRYVAYAIGVEPQNIVYENGVISINNDNNVVKLSVNSDILRVNGNIIQMDTKPEIVNNRVMVPVYWISKAFGINISWNQSTYSVTFDYIEKTGSSLNINNSTLTNNSSSLATSTNVNPSNDVSKQFSWQYRNATYSLELQIPTDILNWDRKIPAIIDTFYNSNGEQQSSQLSYMSDEIKTLVLSCSEYANNNYTPWVTEESNYDYVKDVAKTLLQMAQNNGFDNFHTAEFVQSFVESIPYKVTDTPELPVQTLVDGGDCKDKSILLASLLKNLGYNVALLVFPPPQNQQVGHMAVGIAFNDNELPLYRDYDFTYYSFSGTKYYFAETTSPGWLIGQLSDDSLEQTAYIYAIS